MQTGPLIFTFGESVTAGGAETEAPAASRAASAAAQQPAAATAEQENLFWRSIVDSTNPAVFEAYLEQFPNGVFRALAQVRLAELRAPGGDAPAVRGPRGGGAGSPPAGSRPAVDRDAPLRAGELRVFDGMEFVWVPAGEFRMGYELADQGPVTRVAISRGFYLGKYEVTQGQWEAVMGGNPSHFKNCGRDCPVEQVSWEDVQAFIAKLNAMDGRQRYRLPTEAEWEYAARGGATGHRFRYSSDLNVIAWCGDNGGDHTHSVGGKAPNGYGLHDMLGNVSEWVQDWYGRYPGGTVTDPQGPRFGSDRVIRGGSWRHHATRCRSAFRSIRYPSHHSLNQGFRLLRTE